MDLEQLRALAGTDVSTGYLIGKQHRQLEKAGAHRWLTGLNRSPADGSVGNSRARETVYRTLRDSLVASTGSRLTENQKHFLRMAAEELGVGIDGDFAISGANTSAKPLARSVVRKLIRSLDFVANGVRIDPGKSDNASLAATLNTLGTIFEDSIHLSGLRDACSKILLAKLGPDLTQKDFLNVGTRQLRRLTFGVLYGSIGNARQFREQASFATGPSRINAEEMIEMAESYKASSEQDRELVRIVGEKVAHGPVKYELHEVRPEAAEKKEDLGWAGQLKAKMEAAAKMAKRWAKPTDGEMQKIQAMLADLIYDEDTLETDERAKNPADVVAYSLKKNVQGLALLLAKGQQLIGERNPVNPEKPDEDPGWKTEPLLQGVARDIAEAFLSSGLEALLENFRASDDPKERDIAAKIDLARSPKDAEELADLAKKDAKAYGEYIEAFKEGQQLASTWGKLAYLGMLQQFGLSEKCTESLEEMEAILARQIDKPEFRKILGQIPAKLNGEIDARFEQAQGLISKAFQELVGKSHGGQQEFVRGERNLVQMLQDNGMWKDQFPIEDIKDPAKRKPNGVPLSRQEYSMKLREAQQKRQERKVKIVETSRQLLDKMMQDTGFSADKGYGRFMTLAMGSYFTGMATIDKRSMLAAGIRYAKPLVQVPGNAPEDVQEAAERRNKANMLGAFFKGAGPLMQKMLQGLASVDMGQAGEDLKAALEDMKSNLAPISNDFIKANLLDMVRRSGGRIQSITVKESLGAASVGQAFLCQVKLAEPDKDGRTEKEVVIKLLRPDAEQRLQREKAVFLSAAERTPGMKVTFAGQLQSVEDELDLRKEAVNTRGGAVYDRGTSDVKSMKLLGLIAPTKYSMVIEKAPGVTVDKLFKKIDAGVKGILDGFVEGVTRPAEGGKQAKVTEVGKYFAPESSIQFKKWGSTSEFLAKSAQALDQLSKMYEETRLQQERLIHLSTKWCGEGIYKSGFYHGDLHAGNIMVDDSFQRDADGKLKIRSQDRNGKVVNPDGNKGLTVIDFGNATKLTESQQTEIIRMMTAAAVKDTNRFMQGFRNLMSEGGRPQFDRDRKVIHDMIHNVFNLGTPADAGKRIAIVLTNLQSMGHELPAPIFKFSQCQIRLQGTVDEMNTKLAMIRSAMEAIGKAGSTFGDHQEGASDTPSRLANYMGEIRISETDRRHENVREASRAYKTMFDSRARRHPELVPVKTVGGFEVVEGDGSANAVRRSTNPLDYAPGQGIQEYGPLGEDDGKILASLQTFEDPRNQMLNRLVWLNESEAMFELSERYIQAGSPHADDLRRAQAALREQLKAFTPAYDRREALEVQVAESQKKAAVSPEVKQVFDENERLNQLTKAAGTYYGYQEMQSYLAAHPNTKNSPSYLADTLAALQAELGKYLDYREMQDIQWDEYAQIAHLSSKALSDLKRKVAAYDFMQAAAEAAENFDQQAIDRQLAHTEQIYHISAADFDKAVRELLPEQAEALGSSHDADALTAAAKARAAVLEAREKELRKADPEIQKQFDEASATLKKEREALLRVAAVLADQIELCQMEEVRGVALSMQASEKRLPTQSSGSLTEPEDFCGALGSVIETHQKSTLGKLGFLTVAEYNLTGKLKDSEPVPRVGKLHLIKRDQQQDGLFYLRLSAPGGSLLAKSPGFASRREADRAVRRILREGAPAIEQLGMQLAEGVTLEQVRAALSQPNEA